MRITQFYCCINKCCFIIKALLKDELLPLGKSVSVPLGFTAISSAINAVIQKKIFRSGTTLIISNEEMNN